MLEEAAASKPGSQAIILCELVVDRWGATRWEPELDRRSEDLHRAFDPMLVEVDTCLRPGSLSMGAAIPTPFGVLGACESPILPGPDEPRVDSEDSGALGLGLEVALQLWPRI
jgi:hypothetical protein